MATYQGIRVTPQNPRGDRLMGQHRTNKPKSKQLKKQARRAAKKTEPKTEFEAEIRAILEGVGE